MQALTVAVLALSVFFQTQVDAYPNITLCRELNWNLGNVVDPDAPAPGTPLPLSGQRVYIWGPKEFCINLPDPDSPYLQNNFYKNGRHPSIVEAEGFVRSFCYGHYLASGSLPMPAGGIISAHVIKNFSVPGKNYFEIYGQMDCSKLGINCKGTSAGAYDDGGQYDSVPFRSCGKEPYSGVDPERHPSSFQNYVEQAGDGIFCMRVCEGGTTDGDPCNAKKDTEGCSRRWGFLPMRCSRMGSQLWRLMGGDSRTFFRCLDKACVRNDESSKNCRSRLLRGGTQTARLPASVSLHDFRPTNLRQNPYAMLAAIALLLSTTLPHILAVPPNIALCREMHWNLGDMTDPDAPKSYPVPGQQVYIQDAVNFYINLPDPNSDYLIETYYSTGIPPTIVQAEGYVQSFCMGTYKAPGSLQLPDGGIRGAHGRFVNNGPGYSYYEIYGTLDCVALNITCVSSAPGLYDDGGQYDSVPFKNCGKEPYSGVDSTKHAPTFKNYVEQAGDGLFCMRICEGGTSTGDPCNAKMDEAGCMATFDLTYAQITEPGFTFDQGKGGGVESFSVSLPPLRTTDSATSFTSATIVNASASPTTGFSSNSSTTYLPTRVELVPTAASGSLNASTGNIGTLKAANQAWSVGHLGDAILLCLFLALNAL